MLINHPYYFLIYSNSNTAFYIVEACHYFTVYVFHYNYIFLNEKNASKILQYMNSK